MRNSPKHRPLGDAALAFRLRVKVSVGVAVVAAVGDRGVCGDRVDALSGVPVGSAG